MPRKPSPDSMFYEVEAIHTYGVDVVNREIYLCGEESSVEGDGGGEPGVEFIMASRLIRNIRYLATQEKSKPVLIHMKTSGGYWTEGMAIYDAIKACPAPVHILNYTHARSMSSIILQAADWRVMMPHSYFMFHLGTYETGGDYRAVVSEFDFAKRDTATMLDLYVRAIAASDRPKWEGYSERQIRSKLEKSMRERGDVFLTADEAVEWGLADAVFDHNWGGLKTA